MTNWTNINGFIFYLAIFKTPGTSQMDSIFTLPFQIMFGFYFFGSGWFLHRLRFLGKNLSWNFCLLSFRYDLYSDQEANFEKNWPIAVYYLGAAHLPTTLNRAHSFQRGLPPQVLVDTSIAPFIPDFTPLQNKVLVTLNLLGDIDRLSGKNFKSVLGNKSELYRLEVWINYFK